jgi:hypothetical protein
MGQSQQLSYLQAHILVSHCISIEEETQAGDQYNNPLIALSVDGLIDLPHANISIL